MTIRTDWLPSALGPGGESDEANERFGITTEYRSTRHCPGYEVRITGDISNVVQAVQEWWETGDDQEDLDWIKTAFEGAVVVDLAAEAAAAALKSAEQDLAYALNAAWDARAALDALRDQK